MSVTAAKAEPSNQRWWAVLLVAALVLLAVEYLAPGGQAPSPADERPIVLAGLAESYDDEIARIDVAVDNARGRADEHPDQWLMHEIMARALIARGRMSGSYDDFAAAQASLDRAFALAPERAGPHMTQAQLDFTMHRLSAAERQLARIESYGIPPGSDERAEIAAMRGDIAFYRGDYAGARRRYDEADRLAPGTASFRRAIYAARTGDVDEADRIFAAAARGARLPTRLMLADYALQRGILDLGAGRWEEAKAHFDYAGRLFPGYWLIEAHQAQALALAGDTRQAIAKFERVAERSGSPEAMDALAALYRYEGDAAQAGRWAARAGQVWAERLRLFPEAARGHALEHELAFGDPARALDLARRDFANRRFGGAATGLGWAWLANNRPNEALAAIAPVLRSPWRSAEAQLVAAQAYAMLGDGERAEAEQEAALEINPKAADPASALIWFGH